MSRPEQDGSPIQPDGSLLSLVGDLLFAGAILVMIYPCLRKTVSRLDGQFFRQFFHILEILVAVTALCFVLMLLIGQQMRIAYCSFIRPYVGDSDEDKAYVSVLLKILVCVLLLVNYFCASGLHRLVGFLTGHFQPPAPVLERMRIGGPPRSRCATFGDALTNNSNTNSQTPVTQTQSVMQSDILPSMSFPELSSEACQGPTPPVDRHQRLCRDVGTMVRFPVTEYQHSSQCTLRFCPLQSSNASTVPATIVYTSIPSDTTPRPRHSTPVFFQEKGSRRNTYQDDGSSRHNPLKAGVPSAGRYCSGIPRVKSSCQVHLNNFRGVNHTAEILPCGWGNFPSPASKAKTSCSSDPHYHCHGQGSFPVESDPPSSCLSSDSTGSESSSCVSNQSSFLSRLGLTSVHHDGQSPRMAFSVHSCLHKDLGFAGAQTRSSEDPQTQPQSSTGSAWTQTDVYDPAMAKSSCQSRHSSVIVVNSHSHVPRTTSVASSGPSGTVPTHLHNSSQAVSCVMSGGPNSYHSNLSGMECGCNTSHKVTRVSATTRTARRRNCLPPMPKMTRSGKIYGFG